MFRAIFAAMTSSPANCSGHSTRCRVPESSAMKRGKKIPGSTLATREHGLHSAQTSSSATSTFPSRHRPAIITAATGPETTCSPTVSSVWMPKPASASGTISSSITISGIGISPSRSVAAGRDCGRKTRQNRGAGDQAGLCLRFRSRDRRTGVADRRAPGSADRRSWRKDIADTANPDQACRL